LWSFCLRVSGAVAPSAPASRAGFSQQGCGNYPAVAGLGKQNVATAQIFVATLKSRLRSGANGLLHSQAKLAIGSREPFLIRLKHSDQERL
jgi:hypothetical protein